MGRRKTPGLYERGGVWHIDRQTRGSRLCESTGTSDLEEAESHLARRIDEFRQAQVYGVRPKRTFGQAATKYLLEATKVTLRNDVTQLRLLDKYTGDLPLEAVHMGSLQAFIHARCAKGVKTRTITGGLQVVRHSLSLAAGEWRDGYGLTWLEFASKIKLLP